MTPKPQQQRVLSKWVGTARWVYNFCVNDYIQHKRVRTKQALRDLLKEQYNKHPWIRETPRDIFDFAIGEFCTVFVAERAKQAERKIGNNAQPEQRKRVFVKRRTRKDPCSEISIDHRRIKTDVDGKLAFYPQSFQKLLPAGEGCSFISLREQLPVDSIQHDVKIVRERIGHYYLCVSWKSEREAHTPTQRVVALDPGVRTFQTCYDPDGYVVEFGNGDCVKLRNQHVSMDRTQSGVDHLKTRLKAAKQDHDKALCKRLKQRISRMTRALQRKRKKIQNRVGEMHNKVIKFLDVNYDTVLLPSFEVSNMVRKKRAKRQRKLGKKSVREMMSWQHYKFKARLKQRLGDRVVIVDEAYTSKTCGNCGTLNHKLGGSKRFTCGSCGLQADRDTHAARNILLKNIGFIQPLSSRFL